MRNSISAYLFTFINICKQVSRFIIISGNLFTLCKQQQQIFMSEICKCEIRIQHIWLPLLTFVSKSLGSFLISGNMFTLCKQQQQIFMSEICKCEIRIQHIWLPLLTFVSKSLGSFLISGNMFTLCKQQQ